MRKKFIKSLICSVLSMTVVIGCYSLFFGNRTAESKEAASNPGDTGDEVTMIQERLSRLGLYGGEISGVFDLKTAEAVRRFQLYSGLDASGVCDPCTLAKLGIEIGNIEELCEYNRLRFIASAIDAVCADGSYLAKVVVAGIILKRISVGGLFGSTEFSSLDCHDFSKEPSEYAWKAVRDASLGLSPCPEASHFYKKGDSDSYFQTLNVIYKSGKYIFV